MESLTFSMNKFKNKDELTEHLFFLKRNTSTVPKQPYPLSIGGGDKLQEGLLLKRVFP